MALISESEMGRLRLNLAGTCATEAPFDGAGLGFGAESGRVLMKFSTDKTSRAEEINTTKSAKQGVFMK